MANKASFTPEEWNKVLESVAVTGMAVTAAEPSGLFGMLKEALAGGAALAAAKADPNANELVKAAIGDFETADGRAAVQAALNARFAGAKPADIVPRSLEMLRQASTILDAKATYGPGPHQQCNVHLDLVPTSDSASIIMSIINGLTPAGRTPLTSAVQRAAEVLDYKHKPGVIVAVTDGEETCGGSPCDVGKQLHANAAQLTVHVIGYRPKGFSWTGEESILGAKCLADANGGLYIAAETEEDLVEALDKTLGCPMVTQRRLPPGGAGSASSLDIARLASEGGRTLAISP